MIIRNILWSFFYRLRTDSRYNGMRGIIKVWILPILSDNAPAAIRPDALKSARTETAVLAAILVIPTISCASPAACEMIIMPLKAPQVSKMIMT